MSCCHREMPRCRVSKTSDTVWANLENELLQIHIIFWGRQRRYCYAQSIDEETKNHLRPFPELVLSFHQRFSARPDTAPNRRVISSSPVLQNNKPFKNIMFLPPSISRSQGEDVCVCVCVCVHARVHAPVCAWPHVSIHVCTRVCD